MPVSPSPSVSPSASPSIPVGEDVVYSDILDTVKDEIGDLNLMVGLNIQVQKVPTDQPKERLILPAILISVINQEQILLAYNSCDDIVYPVVVYIVDRARNDVTSTNLDVLLYWRQTIRAHFHYKSFPVDLSTVSKSVVVSDRVIYPETFTRKDLYVSGLILNFYSRELRS